MQQKLEGEDDVAKRADMGEVSTTLIIPDVLVTFGIQSGSSDVQRNFEGIGFAKQGDSGEESHCFRKSGDIEGIYDMQ